MSDTNITENDKCKNIEPKKKNQKRKNQKRIIFIKIF